MASIERIAAVYQEALVDQMGLALDRQNDVLVVTAQDNHLLIQLYENDPEYLHLFGFMRGPQDLDRSQLEHVCVIAAERIKCGKVHVDRDGDLRVSVELLVAAPDCIPSVSHLVSILPRALSIFVSTAQRVATELEFALITGQEAHGHVHTFKRPT